MVNYLSISDEFRTCPSAVLKFVLYSFIFCEHFRCWFPPPLLLFAISAILILGFLIKSAGFLLTLTLLAKGVRSRAHHQLLQQVWLAAMATGPSSLHDAGSWFTCLGYTQVAIANMTVAPMYEVNFLPSLL
jgi:hypothetical protein